jgi:hypothetical protein
MASSRVSDERRHPRRPLDPPLPAVLQVVSSPPRHLAVDVLDISAGGACLVLASPRILGRGDRAALLLGDGAQPVQVRWVSSGGCLVVMGVSYALPPA